MLLWITIPIVLVINYCITPGNVSLRLSLATSQGKNSVVDRTKQLNLQYTAKMLTWQFHAVFLVYIVVPTVYACNY